jgi:transposase
MISLPSGTRIWLVAGVTDMRKSFNGLGELVQHALDQNPFSGHRKGRSGMLSASCRHFANFWHPT